MVLWKISICLGKKADWFAISSWSKTRSLLVVLHFSLNTVLVQQREKFSSTPSMSKDWLTSGSSCSASTDAVLAEKPTRDVQVEFKRTEDLHQQQVAEQGRSEVFRNCCVIVHLLQNVGRKAWKVCVKGKAASFIVSADTSDKKTEGKMCIPVVLYFHWYFFLGKHMEKERKLMTQVVLQSFSKGSKKIILYFASICIVRTWVKIDKLQDWFTVKFPFDRTQQKT